MKFTISYRGADGALCDEVVEATGRAECFAQCKARGITPVKVREGASVRSGNNKSSGSPNVKTMWKAAVLVAAVLCVAGGVWWFSTRSGTEQSKSARKKPSPSKTVQTESHHAEEALSVKKPKGTHGVVTNAVAISVPGKTAGNVPEQPVFPSAITNTPDIPPLPPQTFSNASDQVMAMIASADASGAIPPLPISRDIEAEFLASLKQEIVILDTDDEQTRALKQAVKETREEMKRLVDSGLTVAQVLAEHQKLANENAKVRNEAMLELKQMLDSGDIEGAQKYKRKINIALQQMGIAELSIPVTDEERAERAAARRERMLKKRAEQAKAAAQKDNATGDTEKKQ